MDAAKQTEGDWQGPLPELPPKWPPDRFPGDAYDEAEPAGEAEPADEGELPAALAEALAAHIRKVLAERGGEPVELDPAQIRLCARLLPPRRSAARVPVDREALRDAEAEYIVSAHRARPPRPGR
jgi:hypothetical protein